MRRQKSLKTSLLMAEQSIRQDGCVRSSGRRNIRKYCLFMRRTFTRNALWLREIHLAKEKHITWLPNPIWNFSGHSTEMYSGKPG